MVTIVRHRWVVKRRASRTRVVVVAVCAAGVLVLCSGCRASVVVGRGDPKEIAVYREVWRHDLGRIHSVSATATKSCGSDGSVTACQDASKATVAALQTFVADLEGLDVPVAYERATQLVIDGLQRNVRALEMRVAGLATGDMQKVAEADSEVAEAGKVLQRGYLAFPLPRPAPDPFDTEAVAPPD